MKRLLLFFLFLPAVLCPAAEVGLETLPWTDAAYSWTPDGSKLPQINRNLSGKGAISIGGVRFERGICGHTGFSIVYNLDKNADSFSAMIGLDDERHPKDSGDSANVLFAVMVDRKEVFHRLMRLGEKPEAVEIDLRGKSQLELRGEYGTCGFLLQRVAWGTPVIRTKSPEKLRAALELNRKKHERNLRFEPVYPAAPHWKRIRIRKTAWNGFQNAYHIENGRLGMTVVPEFGGRIMEFSANGKTSLLKPSFVSGQRAVVRGRCGDSGGGHFMRVQPSKAFHPNDPLLQHGKFRIEFPAEGEIRMTSAESALFQAVYEYRIRILPDTDDIEITNTLINTAPYERLLGIWSITRLDSFLLRRILLPPEQTPSSAEMIISKRGNAVKLTAEEQGTELQMNIKPKTPHDFFELRAKCGKAEITAEAKNGSRLRFSYRESRRSADGEFPVHLFLCDRFTEIESHGPTRLLKPGERISLTEKWTQ